MANSIATTLKKIFDDYACMFVELMERDAHNYFIEISDNERLWFGFSSDRKQVVVYKVVYNETSARYELSGGKSQIIKKNSRGLFFIVYDKKRYYLYKFRSYEI